MRLELLEGIVAFHCGNRTLARRCLQSAQAKWEQLQVSDDQLAALAAMGIGTQLVSPHDLG